MALPDDAVNTWFDQNLEGFMDNDVGAAIKGCGNYAAALLLVCYTEVLGAVSKGLLGISHNVETNFNAGLALLDAAASADGVAANYYSTFPVSLDGTPSSLYVVLRCGLVHEYFTKASRSRIGPNSSSFAVQHD